MDHDDELTGSSHVPHEVFNCESVLNVVIFEKIFDKFK